MDNASSRGWVFSSVVTALVFAGVCVRGQLHFSLKVSQNSSLGKYHLCWGMSIAGRWRAAVIMRLRSAAGVTV